MKQTSPDHKVKRPIADFAAALFDLDGTILDSLHVWHDVDVEFLRRRNLPVVQDYLDTIKTMSFIEAAEHTIGRFHLKETPQKLFEEWHEMAYRAYADTVELLPGVTPYIHFLAGRGIRLGIATLGTPDLYLPCLKRHGLSEFFDVICDRSQVARGKDHPDLFLLAAGQLGYKPSDILLFEDIPEFLQTAGRAGFLTCGVNCCQEIIEAADVDFCIEHFDQAPQPRQHRQSISE